MPQTKAKFPKGSRKILNAKGRVSKKLKVKHRLLRSNRKVIRDNEGLSKTPKDNANEVSTKPNKPFCSKKEIPLVEPNSQDILNRLPTDSSCRGKIQLHKNKEKESSDSLKCLENNLECENSESILTSKTCKDNTCDLLVKKTVNNTDANTNIGNKTRKRRKPFAHINETQDYLLSPIVLLERLSIEKIKQNIFTNKEKLVLLNCTKNIDNDLSTQISENINPSKRRKKSLHRSCTRRKSQPNSESEPIPTCSEKESENRIVQEIKKNEKIVNLEKESVDKLTSKSALNKDNAEESNLTENEHSQNIHTVDQSESKNNLSANKSKIEKSANKIESESISKKKTEFEKNENYHNASANRKTSLRQKNQKASVLVNTSASVSRRSKNVSEDGMSQHECKIEKRLTEGASESLQNMSISEENKNVSTNETCRNECESEKRKIEPKNKEDQLKLENKFQKDCTGEKIANKLKGKKGKNASTEKSLQIQNEPKNEKNKKSIDQGIENTFVSTRSKNKLENKSVNIKDKNEDRHENLNESEHKNSQHDKLKSEKCSNKSVGVIRRSQTEIKEFQSEPVKEKYSKGCISVNIEKKLENEKSKNSPIIEKCKHTKEKFDNKSADKKIRNTSVIEKRQNESKKEKVRNKSVKEKHLNVNEKNKISHDTEDQSQSKSQDEEENDKHLNESVTEKCQIEPKNVENQNTLQKRNRHNLTENKNTQVEQNFNRVLNTTNMNSVQESIISDAIKSEIESDDADSSEENEVLNIKIFEMDNAININEDDLVSSQLKKSMRVESEPFKNNEVVNVKIFQIDKSLDIENCSSQTCVRETMENPTETEKSTTNIKLVKDNLNDIEEKKLIDSGIEKLSKTVESNIEVEKPTTSDELISGKSKNKSKDIEEKILTDACAIIDDQEKNENEIESDALKNKVVIKVKIVIIDKPLEVKDSFRQFSDSKTINDQIEGEEITGGLDYELDNGKLMDTNEKTSNYSPAKSVSKTVKKKIENKETASSSEISKGRLKSSDIKDFEKRTNYNEVSNDKSKEITEKTLTETCAKIDDQEKNLFEKICSQENETMEVESEPFINNEILKIKIFENDKALNIEDYLSQPCIEKAFEDKIESMTTTINSELNEDKLKSTEEKTIESGTKNATLNDNTEKILIDSCSKSFGKNIQNKIKTLKTTNKKELSNSESKFTEENTLTDSCSNVVSKTGIAEEKDTKSSNESSKEELLNKNCEKAIRNVVEDKIETGKNESVNELSEVKSKATKEKVLIDSGSKSITKMEKKKVEAEKTKSRNELRDEKPKATTDQKSEINSSNTVKDKIEAKKIAKSIALSTDEPRDKEGETINDLYVIKTVQDKIEVEKSDLSNKLKESKLNATIEKSLIKSCAKNVNTIVEDKSKAGTSKGGNVLSDEKSKAIQEKMVINSCEKSVSNIVKDKPLKSTVLSKGKSNDKEGITANDFYVQSVIKTVQANIDAEKRELINKLKQSEFNVVEKPLTKSFAKNVNTMVEDKSEAGTSNGSNVLSDEKAKVTQEKMVITSCEKSVKDIVKDKPSKNTVVSTDESNDTEGITANDFYVQSVIKTVQAKIDAEKRELINKLKQSEYNATVEKSLTKSCAKNVNEIVEDKSEAGKSKGSNALSDENSKASQEKTSINPCVKSNTTIVEDKTAKSNVSKSKCVDNNEKTANSSCTKSVSKLVQNKIETEKTDSSNDLSELQSNDSNKKSLIDSCTKRVSKIVEDKIETKQSKNSSVVTDKKAKDTAKEKSLIESSEKSVNKTMKNKIEAEKSENSNTLNEVILINEIILIDSDKKTLPHSYTKRVSKPIKDKIEAEKTEKSDTLNDVILIDTDKKTLPHSCTQSVSKPIKDKIEEEKTEKSNIVNEVILIDTDKKTLPHSCTKSVSKSIKDKIEADETTKTNDSQNKKLNNKEKVVVETCSNTVKNKIEEMKAKSSELNEDKSRVSNKKSLIDSCEQNVTKSVKDKIEKEKTAKDNVLSKDKSKDTNEKISPDSCIISVDKTKSDKIELKKTVTANDSHNKILNDLKEKVIVKSCLKTVSNSVVKEKIVEEKTKSNDELSNHKSRPTKEKSLIDSCEKHVSESVKDNIAKNTEISKDKSEDCKKKIMPDTSVKSISKTKNDKIVVEKTIIDDNLHNKNLNNIKENISVEPSAEIVSESVKGKIETKKLIPSNNTSNEKKELKSTGEKLLHDSGAKIVSNITRDKIDSEKPSSKEVDKSKDDNGKSLTDSCAKNTSETANNEIDEEITTHNESSKEKSKETENKSLTDSCIGVNVLDKKKTLETKPRNAITDNLQNLEEEIIPDANKKIDEVESREELSAQQESNSVAVCALKSDTRDSKSSKKSKKKKPNKYRRLKKHMIRKRKKKNRVKITGNELIKTKSSKMMELLGTICRNKIQAKSQDSERIVKPIKIKLNNPVYESVRNKYSALVNESIRNTFSTSVNQSVQNKFRAKYRDPVTGKFCSKAVAKRKTSLDRLINKSVPVRSEVIENTAGLKKNKSVPVNSKEMEVSNELTSSNLISNSNKNLFSPSANSSISNRIKSPDTRKNTSMTQLTSSRGNFSNQNRTSTQAVENVVQEEITIEEHEIKIEEEPEVLEIIVSEEEEASNINYVTASEIFSGINSRANKTTSRAEILKNLRSILPLNKGSSLLRTNCINVNNERNSVLESNGELGVSENTNRNLHRYMDQPSRSRASLPSQQWHNQNSRNINIISDDNSNDGLHINDRRNNYHSINIQDHSFNDSVASTSANSNNAMSISVREAYEKISSDLLGAYDPQSEIDPQDYSNGINDLLHISDSDDDQMSENNADSDHHDDNSVIQQHNNQSTVGGNTSQSDNQSNVFYQKPVKKRAVDETMHMLLQCPRCFAECLGMKRLQRHYSKCGVPALFTCTICQTKLKQKRSLASHYLSYHADLVSEDTLPDVIAETVRRSTDERNFMMNGRYITLPSHVSVFCDKCQSIYRTVPESHRLSCERCLQPLTYYCEKCTRRQVLSLRVQIHAQSKCSERPCCPHCGHVAATPSRLREHMTKQHGSDQTEVLLTCRHGCGLTFRQKHSMLRHEAHCAKEKDQLCRFCPFKTKHRSVIKVHMQQHMINNDISPAQAATADKTTTDEVSLLIEAYCQMCRGVYDTPVLSGTRCPRCHGGALYRCRGCGIADTVYREMRRHVTQRHVNQSPARGRPPLGERPCRMCGDRFDDTLGLRRHQRAKGGCRPRCRRCDKSFINAGSLKRHLEVSCGIAPGLSCEHCTFVTRNRFSLVRHLQTQHADVFNGSKLACPKCGLLFSNIYLYDKHVEAC